jgi:hypothetical protein
MEAKSRMELRILLAGALFSGALGLVTTASAGESVPEWLTRSRAMSAELGTELKAELAKALAQSGPSAAIEVCRLRAPEIAARLSAHSGAKVSRTALRVRNPANAPDDLQRAVLEQFAADLASGPVQPPLEAAVEINRGGQIERRYMRAIPTDALCLTCHGTELAPDVKAAIAKAYPDDQATGFTTGQLRGAFSVIWPAVPMAAAKP